VAAVVLSCVSAALFGAMTVALRLGLRRGADAETGALVCTGVAFLVAALAAVVEPAGHRAPPAHELVVFALAGLLAPGGSQMLFVWAVRDAGASRTSVVVGAAPLVSVAIAILVLGEPVRLPLVAGAVLVVLGGVTLVGERIRPHDFRMVGAVFAFAATVLFSTRDNLVRWYSHGASAGSVTAAAAALAAGTAATALVAAATRRGELAASFRRLRPWPFVLAGILFGLSYVSLFEAYYRGRVTVVSPLVASESLWGVLLAALVLGRSELIGPRLVAGAGLIVAGGAIIGVYR
jgi:drug/metabolite transporter (DMT)-like permease